MSDSSPADLPKRAAKLHQIGRSALQVGAIGFALMTSLVVFLFVLLGGTGLHFDSLQRPIEQGIASKLDAEAVEIGELRLMRDQAGANPFRVTITDFTLDQGEGSVISLPNMSMRMSGQALLRGKLLPKFVEIDGASVVVERQGEDVSLGGNLDLQMLLSLADEVSAIHGTGFEGAVLNDFTFVYADLEAGTRFEARKGTASLRERNGDYDFDLIVPFPRERGRMGTLGLMASMDSQAAKISVAMEFNRAPAGELLSIFLADEGEIAFDAPVTGRLSADGSLTGGLSDLTIDLAFGEGLFRFRDHEVPVTSLKLAGVHDVFNRTLTINALDIDAGGIKAQAGGSLSYEGSPNGITALQFGVSAKEVTAELGELFDGPLPIDLLELNGRYEVTARSLDISIPRLNFYDAVISGTAGAQFPEEQGELPAVQSSLVVEGILSPQEVLLGWPVPAGDGARRWVVANMPDGEISDVTFELDFPGGNLSNGWPEEALLDLNFRADKTTVIYAPTMTPVTNLSATARILGNRFTVQTETAQLGAVAITGGGIDMPEMVPKGGPAIFTVLFDGQLKDILGIIDEEPLGYVSKAGFAPTDFGGRGKFTLEIIRPLLSYVPMEEYRFSGTGSFSNLTLSLFESIPALETGRGTVTLKPNSVSVTGVGEAEGAAANFEWTRPFGENASQSLISQIRLNPRTADAFGLPLRRYMRGEADMRIEAKGGTGAFEEFNFSLDLTPATLIFGDGQLIKAKDEPGLADLTLTLPDDSSMIMIPEFRLQMPRANIQGNARFTDEGGLVDLDLPRLWVEDLADLSLRLSRDDFRVRISAEGEYANFSGLIDQALSYRPSGGSPLPGGVDLEVELNRVNLKGGSLLQGVKISGHHDGVSLARLTADGSYPDGGALSLKIAANPMGLGEDMTIETDRFGQLLRGVFGIESVMGGEAQMTATLIDDGPIAGQFVANDIVMKDAPLIAQLLSIGSLDGLENVLNGEGLAFSDLGGDIQLEDGILRLVNARLTGSSLGLSANGQINLSEQEFGLHGAVAPAYGVNSLIGEVPGLGSLFVSRKGEGVFALSYRIDGPMNEATVQVNTLAALTPGIFRRIFEPIGGDLPSTQELLTAAEESAEDEMARDFLSTPELLREYEQERAERRPAQEPQ